MRRLAYWIWYLSTRALSFGLDHRGQISADFPTLSITTSTPTLRQRANTVVIVTVTTTPSAAPISPSYTDPALFKSDVLNQSNYYRHQHNASDVTWNETLVAYAQKWADRCDWKHSGGPYGENLAEGYNNVTAAINAWAIEGKYYHYSPPTGFSEKTGHFTQLVWKATTDVGCGVTECSASNDGNGTQGSEKGDAQGWFLVCEYWPPGNVVGDGNEYFKENVDPSVSLGPVRLRLDGIRIWWFFHALLIAVYLF